MSMFQKRFFAKYMGEYDGNNNAGGGGDAAAAAAAAAEAAKAAEAVSAAEAAKVAAEEEAAKASAGKPSDAEAKLLKEVMQKKEAYSKLQSELEAFKKQFDGIDPSVVRAQMAAQVEAETKALEAKGEWERLKARMADEHGKQTSSLQEQITALQAQLGSKESVINDLSIGTSFAQSQFIANELTLTPSKARVVYSNHFDLVDGKIVGYDKPKGEASRTPLIDALGNPIAFESALRKIIDADPDKDALLKSKVRVGAGSDSTSSAKVKVKSAAETTGIDKIASGLKGLNIQMNVPLKL